MGLKETIKEIDKLQQICYSIKVNDKEIPNVEFLKILFNKFEKENFQKWNQDGSFKSHLDFRFHLFAKLELATLHYYQAIHSYLGDSENIYIKTKELGYSEEFIASSFLFGEVAVRTNFVERIFFTIDYFIQQMNTQIQFKTSGTSHKKQFYFKLLLEHLNIENEEIDIHSVIDDLNYNISNPEFNNLFKKTNNRKIQFHEIYNYFVALRNVFHNNGFSQKTVNKLDIGGIVIDIKKGELITYSNPVVVISVYLMLFPLKRIIERTIEKYPDEYWEDKYTKVIDDFKNS
jgi:hypothetical protein